MRIVYAGTPEFAVVALERLVAAGHEIAVVYTQPDRHAGRGRELSPSPVKLSALAHGLSLEQPATLRSPDAAPVLARYAPELLVVAAYGLLLPPAVLAVPAQGCLNIHASLLPRWRGAAPVQRAIEAGDAETGVCIMRMEQGLDTGPVYARRSTAIGNGESAGLLTQRLAALGADLLVEVLAGGAAALPVPVPQPDEGVTYARKLEKREARIDWLQPATLLARRVRAFAPWPVAETSWAGQALRIWAADADHSPCADPPGTVTSVSAQGIGIATGDGVLRLTRVQLAGRKPVSAREFLHAAGASLAVGTALGS